MNSISSHLYQVTSRRYNWATGHVKFAGSMRRNPKTAYTGVDECSRQANRIIGSGLVLIHQEQSWTIMTPTATIQTYGASRKLVNVEWLNVDDHLTVWMKVGFDPNFRSCCHPFIRRRQDHI
jgi:hypothetical protein